MTQSKNSLRVLGKKVGMTRIFDDEGNLVVCTVIATQPNVVTRVKTKESDGYSALQMGAFRVEKKKRVAKPQLKSFEKIKVDPRKTLFESRLTDVSSYSVGQEIGVDQFAAGEFLDITGVSKGKGFQGVIKRYGHKGGPAAHGSGFHRHGGSTGMRSTPGRTFPGMKMPGHMGCDQKTVQNLKVVKVDAEKQLILVKGPVPGFNGASVWMKKAIKRTK